MAIDSLPSVRSFEVSEELSHSKSKTNAGNSNQGLFENIGNLHIYKYFKTLPTTSTYSREVKIVGSFVKQIAQCLNKNTHELEPADFFRKPVIKEILTGFKSDNLPVLKRMYMYLLTNNEIPSEMVSDTRRVLFPEKKKSQILCHPSLEAYLVEQRITGVKDISTQRKLCSLFYKYCCKQLGLPEKDWINIDNRVITEKMVEDYHNYLVYLKAHGRISVGTFRNRIIRQRHYLKYLELNKEIRFGCSHLLRFSDSLQKMTVQILDDPTIMKIFEAIKTKSKFKIRDIGIFSLFISTGCRPCEIERLTVTDYDSANKTIKYTGKSGKQRVVPIPVRLIPILNEYVKTRPIPFSPKDSSYLFLTDTGKRFTVAGLGRLFKTLLGEEEVLGITIRLFRHTFATKNALSGVDPLTISTLLGHASVNETDPYYEVDQYGLRTNYNEKCQIRGEYSILSN